MIVKGHQLWPGMIRKGHEHRGRIEDVTAYTSNGYLRVTFADEYLEVITHEESDVEIIKEGSSA